ncbi:MAG: hypothetical protein ACI9PN_002433 [Candidatus Azotimanducaceae bacterium]|jgi:hypothetical protein
MYGLIHTALRQLVTERYSVEQWNQVLEIAELPFNAFLSTQSYDDAVTLNLVSAVSEVLETPIEQCLEIFGQFWLAEFAPQSYDMLLSAVGGSLFDFLDNLNNLHDRISTTFIGYGPPSFKLQRYSESEGMLEYRSARSGMVPFVVGLIRGMEDRFGVQITIKSVEVTSTVAGDSALIYLKVE